MRKKISVLLLILFPLCVFAKGQEDSGGSKKSSGNKGSVFSGVSGGISVNIGYLFSDSPDKLFSNSQLGTALAVQDLPKDGVGLGCGAIFRIHLINHIHLGAEGQMSIMPLMKSGSNVRSGWGGALCDYYFSIGKIRPLAGLGVGGGVMKRLYVPEDVGYSPAGSINYNASYTKTPFFYLDPYVGMEIGIGESMAIFIKVDYMLQFGATGSKLTASDVRWSNFMTPSGPRLHVGFLLGSMGKKD